MKFCLGTNQNLRKPVSEALVWLALDGLKRNNLLENVNELSNYFVGLTRREAVKRIGATTMVALPVIVSIVALPAVLAGGLRSYSK